ncbi:MAG: hypothetical protein ACFE9L_14650 [Candidatus Hodarchaeota archaeon]
MKPSKVVVFCLLISLITYSLNIPLFDVIVQRKSYKTSGNEQNNIEMWCKSFGGEGPDEAYALLQTTDGGFALAGYTDSFGAGGYDMWLVKTDADGTAQWNQTYGGPVDDEAYTLLQTTDGGFALGGVTKSYGTSWNNMWLVKTDANGTAQWNKTYNRPYGDYKRAFIETTDDGFALVGYSPSLDPDDWDMWLIKTNAYGTVQWNQTYGGSRVEEAFTLIQTADGGFALAGVTHSYNAGSRDMWLVKTYSNGTFQWSQAYGGLGFDIPYALIQTTDGGFALAGYTHSFGAGDNDMWLIKTDAEGKICILTTGKRTSGLEIFSLLTTVIFLTIWSKKKKYLITK